MKYGDISQAIKILEKLSKNVVTTAKIKIYTMVKYLKCHQDTLMKVNNEIIEKYVLRGPYNEKKKIQKGNIYFWDFGENLDKYEEELNELLSERINDPGCIFLDNLNNIIECLEIQEIIFLEDIGLIKIGEETENGRTERSQKN